jgi:hypothetical protein
MQCTKLHNINFVKSTNFQQTPKNLLKPKPAKLLILCLSNKISVCQFVAIVPCLLICNMKSVILCVSLIEYVGLK